jgi:hemoglobin
MMTESSLRARPVWFTPPADVDDATIEKLVRGFYGRVREDALLGPIFQGVVGEDWEPHLAKLCDFWSSVALGSGRYKGTPMQAHLAIAGLTPAHFEHWLSLFRQTAREVCSPEAARFFINRAERIADSLQTALFFRVERA